MTAGDRDVLVIGAGHNGLVAANYLCDAGPESGTAPDPKAALPRRGAGVETARTARRGRSAAARVRPVPLGPRSGRERYVGAAPGLGPRDPSTTVVLGSLPGRWARPRLIRHFRFASGTWWGLVHDRKPKACQSRNACCRCDSRDRPRTSIYDHQGMRAASRPPKRPPRPDDHVIDDHQAFSAISPAKNRTGYLMTMKGAARSEPAPTRSPTHGAEPEPRQTAHAAPSKPPSDRHRT
ncbi:hypothetical protein BKA01_007439 [Pseudonocardia eucalypti]|nr:hypothetical protein [Pseudonocardia eucalypti]